MNNRHPSKSPPLIEQTRTLLENTGLPWVLENVTGARQHMHSPLALHGGMFNLDLYRPRLFETNTLILAPPPAPRPTNAAAIYGNNDQRHLWTRTDGTRLHAATLERARTAMNMPWATWDGVREAIPPDYTHHIGTQLLQHLQHQP